jgi:hypothetical protein
MRAELAKALSVLTVAAVIAGTAWVAPVQALVRPAVMIDGPGTGVISLGGVAMAPDGTGGLVYLKTDQGEPHVFVSQFIRGRWLAPRRVDTSLPFDSSWPQIGAGDGGRLVVVWAQSFAKDPLTGVSVRQLYSATLKPGSSSFIAPVVVDSNLATANATGDEAVSELYPSIAMNAIGQAYLAYRVLTNACDNGCANPQQGTIYRPGDSFADFRLARFNGETWSVLGAINRNTAFSVRPGTSDNSPRVTIDSSGHGVVAFQEQDNSGFDRIWARRLFGTTIGQILRVSASTLDGVPIDGDADAFDLGGTDNGGAIVTYRQEPPPGSESVVPRELVNLLYPPLAQASQFAGARVLDGGASSLGSPAAAMNDQVQFATAFAGNGALQLRGGDSYGVNTTSSLGATDGTRPGVTIGPDGFTATAWSATNALGQPVVDVEEVPASGHANRAQVAAANDGTVDELDFGASDQGDALVAFRQGVGAGSQIAAAVVQGPPPPFAVQAPPNYVRPTDAVITWLPVHRTLGNVTYSPVIDGVVRARGLTGTSYRFSPRGLQTGTYDVAVIATDDAGQDTVSYHDTLKIDASPHAALDRHGRLVEVRVSDGRPGKCPGLDLSHTIVRFGDGSRPARMRGGRRPRAVVVFRHRFRHRGWFRIRVRARDRAGFARDLVLRVRVS